jgi:hypothetical protein
MVVPGKTEKETNAVAPEGNVAPEAPRRVEVALPAPESPKAPEAFEKGPEAPPPAVEVSEQPVARPVRKPSAPTAPSVPARDEMTKEIEGILSEDLTDLFLKMTPSQQERFKAKGEETASKIRQLVSATKVNAKKVLDLIKDWLKLIPGVNKFFLEQEAKIKTDKVLLAAEERKQQGRM